MSFWDSIQVIAFVMVIGGIANMTPVLVKKLPFLSKPIDGGLSFKGKRLLGEGKTWRGLVFGVLAGGVASVLIIFLQQLLGLTEEPGWADTWSYYVFEYLKIAVRDGWLLGLFLGFFALLGDLLKSFFKRQMGIARGVSWFPFDQLDWVIGLLIGTALLPWIVWSWWYLLALPIGLVLHLVIKFIGHKLKLDDKAI